MVIGFGQGPSESDDDVDVCYLVLRSDEVLRIERRHIRREKIGQRSIVELTLDFRKTHQTGGKVLKTRIKYLLSDANPNYSLISRYQAIFLLSKWIGAVA